MKQLVLIALVALGILFPVTIVPGRGDTPVAAGSEPSFEPQQVDTVVIQIVADADSVVAVPGSVTVAPGQVVTWNSDLGDWMVRFRSDRPFGPQAANDGIRGGRGQGRSQAVRNDAPDGRYKYDIMVQIQGGSNLRADPEIVVEGGNEPD